LYSGGSKGIYFLRISTVAVFERDTFPRFKLL
jgi:hypothetical protein